jgi:hypothetical protein
MNPNSRIAKFLFVAALLLLTFQISGAVTPAAALTPGMESQVPVAFNVQGDQTLYYRVAKAPTRAIMTRRRNEIPVISVSSVAWYPLTRTLTLCRNWQNPGTSLQMARSTPSTCGRMRNFITAARWLHKISSIRGRGRRCQPLNR